MAAYAIDVSNVRVRQAMDFLGIEDSELMVRTQADFAAAHVTPEIQNLRFEYYQKKLEETKRKIKHRMKEERQRQSLGSAGNSVTSMRGVTSRVQLKSATLTSFVQSEESKLARLKEQQKEKIVQALTSLKQEKDAPKPTPAELAKKAEAAEKLQEDLEKKREALEKKKKRHEEKLRTLQEERKKKEKELVRNLKKSMKEHEEREKRQEEAKLQMVRARAMSLQSKQVEVTQKLSAREADLDAELGNRLVEIEERINRNRLQHEEELRKKKEHAAKLWMKAETNVQQLDVLRDELEMDRIRAYAAAQKKAWERKGELTKEQQEKFDKEREKIDKKLAKIKDLQKKQKKDEWENMKKVEARMKQTNKVLEKRQRDWSKQLELRQELQRLHDEDKRTKVERAQRIYVRGM